MEPFHGKLLNSQTAKGGLSAQRAVVELAASWRSDPVGASLAVDLFGLDACKAARRLEARLHDDTRAKPDLLLRLIGNDGSAASAACSLKFIASEMSGPAHHAGRVPFRDARDALLLPADDHELEAALLEMFVDGEPFASRSPELQLRLGSFYSGERLAKMAELVLRGSGPDAADWLLLARGRKEGERAFVESIRVLDTREAARLCASEPFKASAAGGERVGTVGNRWMRLQRGQALSLGEQKDIQIKVDAAALYEAASPGLFQCPSRDSSIIALSKNASD